MANVLYISLNGMTEPLGESQVVQYLLPLAQDNKIALLSFEKTTSLEKYEYIQKKLAACGITWKYFKYSNRYGLFSTVLQITQAFFACAKIIKKDSVKIIHARSLIPAVIGVVLKKTCHIKLLFDIRGFAIDEKIVDGRLKEQSILTRILKKIEAYTYKNADHIVTLTHASKPIIEKKYGISLHKITVIPTCANAELFKPDVLANKLKRKVALGFREEDFVILHNGSLNHWVDFEAELKLFECLARLDSKFKFLFLNKGQHVQIQEHLKKYTFDESCYKIVSADFKDVVHYLNVADLSVFFIKPSFAKQASAPTKFAELVACHLYSITNTGYGDIEYYLNRYAVGRLVDLAALHAHPGEEALRILNDIEKNKMRERNTRPFVDLFYEHFSKEVAVKRYQNVYRELTES